MRILINITVISILLCIISCTQVVDNELQYIDHNKPSIKPILFAKGFITKDSISEFGSVFNEKGTEFFFAIDTADRAFIKYTAIQDGKWIEPITILSHPTYSFNDPFLSPDESKLYYISDMPRNTQDTIEDIDIWYSEKIDTIWSEPINAGIVINSDKNEYYISFTNDGSMYFASNIESSESRSHDFDIYKSSLINGEYQTPEKVSDSINTGRYEADVFISPDESYIIFCSARRSGLGAGDLYISFKDDSGNWTTSISMGPDINTANHELCPFVTKDGKYFFYTSNQDIYWVSTVIIDELKNTVNISHSNK
jgi:hypothetical protein